MNLRSALATSLILISGAAFCGAAAAHEYKLGSLEIGHPYARPTVPGQPAAAAYLSVENKGGSSDKLIALATPVAKSGEVHTMSMDGDIMRMRQVDGIEIKPSEKVAMKPGAGYHLMLIGLKDALKPGDKFPVTLTFEKAGKIEVSVYVEKQDGQPAASHQH